MQWFIYLNIAALTLLAIHFGVPLIYYWYAKNKWLLKPWNIEIDLNYRPKVTIIIPTYNEAKMIRHKLDSIIEQTYPKDKLEVIVIDSASTDGTLDIVRKWMKEHSDLHLKVLEEFERKGKALALNNALKYAEGEVIIITDADSLWLSKRTIEEAVKWFKDLAIGAVSCLKIPSGVNVVSVEEGYRHYYNVLRVAESRAWSTPIFHGELAAFRKELLDKVGGFPIDIGADDSYTATRIALMGYRAIIPENIVCIEITPQNGYHSWRIRRAQHLIQHFLKTLRTKPKTNKTFKQILYIEAYLHLINPWILLITTTLLITSIIMGSILAIALFTIGISLLIYKPYRTWITTQIYLITAAIRNLWTKEITWKKQQK